MDRSHSPSLSCPHESPYPTNDGLHAGRVARRPGDHRGLDRRSDARRTVFSRGGPADSLSEPDSPTRSGSAQLPRDPQPLSGGELLDGPLLPHHVGLGMGGHDLAVCGTDAAVQSDRFQSGDSCGVQPDPDRDARQLLAVSLRCGAGTDDDLSGVPSAARHRLGQLLWGERAAVGDVVEQPRKCDRWHLADPAAGRTRGRCEREWQPAAYRRMVWSGGLQRWI